MKTTSNRAARPGARHGRLRLAARVAALVGPGLAGVAPAAFAGTGSIEGVVFEDLDLDGARDAGEGPLADAPVTLVGSNDWNIRLQATTDASGRFVFTGLVPASYILTSEAVDGYYGGVGTIGSAGGEAIRFRDTTTTSFINLDADEQATGYSFAKVPYAAVPPSTDLYVYLYLQDGSRILTDSPVDGFMVVSNLGYRDVPARVTLTLPPGVSIVFATPNIGTFDAFTNIWTISPLDTQTTAIMEYKLVSTSAGSKSVSAAVDIPDPALGDTNDANDAMTVNFNVIRGPLFEASFGEAPASRVLVLAACPPLAGGAEDAACLASRKASLDALFTVDHLVVANAAEFVTQLRSRSWNTYWLDSGAARTLDDAAIAEITQAQWRGEGLIVDRPRGRSGGDVAGAQKLEVRLPVTRVDAPELPGVMVPSLYNWNRVPMSGGYDIYRPGGNVNWWSNWSSYEFWDANGQLGDPADPPRAFHWINGRTLVFGIDVYELAQSGYVDGPGFASSTARSVPPYSSEAGGRLTSVEAHPFMVGRAPAPVPAWFGVRFPGGVAVRKSEPADAVTIADGFAWTRELSENRPFSWAQFHLRMPVSGSYDVTLDMRQSDANGAPLAPLMTRTLVALGAEDAADRVRDRLPDAGQDRLADRLDAVDALMQQRANGDLAGAIESTVTLAAVLEPWRAGSGPNLTWLATALGNLGAVLSREWYLALPPCAPPANLAGCRTPEP